MGNAGGLVALSILFLALLAVAGLVLLVGVAVVLAYVVLRAYYFRDNHTPRHESVNPTEVPLILQRGEEVLFGHTKSVLSIEHQVRRWTNSRHGAGLGYGRGHRSGYGGLFAWGSSSSGKSWTSTETTRLGGSALLTSKRLVFMSGGTVSEVIPLSELESVSSNWRSILIAAEHGRRIRRYELRLKEDGPAQGLVTAKWVRGIAEACQERQRERIPIGVSSLRA